MMLGRIVAGLGVGALSTIVPVYQSEISVWFTPVEKIWSLVLIVLLTFHSHLIIEGSLRALNSREISVVTLLAYG